MENTTINKNTTSTDTTSSIDKDIEKFISTDLHNALVKENFSPVKKVYVDWTYLQDIYVGFLVMCCKTEKQYLNVRSCIENYNNRITREHVKYFKDINFTEEELLKHVSNPAISEHLLYISPMTNMFTNIRVMISQVLVRNNKLGYDDPITLIVNTYPIKLTSKITSVYSKIFSSAIPTDIRRKVKILLTDKRVDTIDVKTFLDCDVILIDRFDLFLREDSDIATEFYKLPVSSFLEIAIITPKIIDNKEILSKLSTLSKEDIEQIFNTTQSVCGLSSAFQYINPLILLDDGEDNSNAK